MRRLILALVCLVSSSCASEALVQRASSPGTLNSYAPTFDGQEVEVYGYYQDEFENHALWETKEAMLTGDKSKCIEVLVPTKWDTSGFHGTWVVVRGRFLRELPDYKFVPGGGCGPNPNTLWLASHPVLASNRGP